MITGGARRLAAIAFVCLFASAFPADDPRLEGSVGTRTKFVTAPPRSLGEWMFRRGILRRQILTAAGLYPMPVRGPVSARTLQSHRMDRYTVSTVVLETLPGYFLAGNLYMPAQVKGKIPAVLVPHGHWKQGRVHNAPDYSVPALAANLAARGYAAFAYDMTGYNDTAGTPHSFGESAAEQLASFSPLGLQLWNSLRSFDYLAAMPEVDARRIGITGASGGGTQTFLAAAVEERLAVSIPVNMVSAHFQGDDMCEMAPGLRIETNNVEIAALAAPRPQLLISSTKDWTKDTPSVEYPMLRAVYRLYGKQANAAYVQIDAPHNYNRESREAAYAFLRKHLGGSSAAKDLTEDAVELPQAKQLLLAESWRDEVKLSTASAIAAWRSIRAADSLTPRDRRDLLRSLTGAAWPRRVRGVNSGGHIRIDGGRQPVLAQWVPRDADSVAVVIHAGGERAARQWIENSPSIARGASLLVPEVFSLRQGRGFEHLTFHYSDDACRVQDIVSAIAFARSLSPGRIRLVCPGDSGLWCTLAAAVSAVPVHLETDLDHGSEPEEKVLQKYLFVPGLIRAGGLRAIQSLAAGDVQRTQ